MYLAAGLARNTTASAMSLVSPKLANGIFPITASFTAWGSSSVMSVVMKPGATALQVTLRPASSRATALVKPIRPALLAE